jgi:hypothetical protein
MVAKAQTARSIPEFLDLVDVFTEQWFVKERTWGPWFRGHQNAEWSLRPSLYRYPPCARPIRRLEDEIRQEFVVRAPSLSAERPQSAWEWYFLMQHCGAPTRLLDWTESALIALYFAVRGKSDHRDAAVWVLERWKLNTYVAKWNEVIAPCAEAGMVPAHADRYKDWLPDRYSQPREIQKPLPVAIYPTHFSRRISSQRSCFTVHGSDYDGFDHLPIDACQYLQKVIIPGSNANGIERNLAVAGIDELTIFPDLDGLGRWLAAVMRDESRGGSP